MFINPDANLTIKVTLFRYTEWLCELLTRKNMNTQLVGKEDMKTYKKYIDID